MKICRKCGYPKDETTEFNKHPKTKDGLQSWCRDCGKKAGKAAHAKVSPKVRWERQQQWRKDHPEAYKASRAKYQKNNRTKILAAKRRQHLRAYGLTPEAYDQLVAAQGGVCLICGGVPNGQWRRLQVDHCHKTGKIRGLLCVNCNRAIGYLGDDPDRAIRVAAYLKEADITPFCQSVSKGASG